MGKVWIFRETGEVRSLKRGEWFQEPITGEFCHVSSDYISHKFPILSLEVLDHDPLEPIREVYEKYKSDILRRAKYCTATYPISYEMAKAIKKAIEGEGK